MARALAVFNVALLLACGDDAQPADTTDVAAADSDRPDAPTPWIYAEDTSAPTPTLSAAARQDAIKTAMDAALELDPGVVRDLYTLLYPMPEVGSGDPTGCPFFLTFDYGTAKAAYWQAECTDSAGTRFSGSGSIAIYDDFVNEGGTFDGFEVKLAGRIEAADGTFLEGAGRAGGYAGGNPQLDAVSLVIDGTFSGGGARAPDSPWLGGSRRPSLTITGWTYRPTGGRNVTVAGGISGLAFPAGVTAVALDDLTARQSSAGASCERELGGGASVRGDDGNWYDVLFDGPHGEVGQTPSELCDGCGATWFRGGDVGTTCLDARVYFTWEGAL